NTRYDSGNDPESFVLACTQPLVSCPRFFFHNADECPVCGSRLRDESEATSSSLSELLKIAADCESPAVTEKEGCMRPPQKIRKYRWKTSESNDLSSWNKFLFPKEPLLIVETE